MSKNNLQYFLLGLILLIHAVVLTKTIFFPYPELFIYPYLTNHGLKPYSQILDQHFPGLMFLPINLDNLGMNNEVVARVWLIGVVIITHLLLFFIARQLLKSSFKALLVNLLYLVWQPFFEGWVLWIDSLLPLLLLPAFAFLVKKKYFLAGLFLSFGIIFKQTIIPLAFFILIYVFWSDSKMVKRYLLGLAPPIILMILYFAQIGVLSDFWYWTVVFNLTVYSATGTQIPTSIGFITRVLFVYVMSLFLLLYKIRSFMIILLIFLAGSLIGAFDRANFVHFQPSLPFAILGTVLGFYSISKKKAILLLSFYLAVLIWWQNIFYKGHLSNKVMFFDQQTYTLANKIKEYTKPGEKIFVFGAAPHLYQMSDTLPAGDIFVFQFPWFYKVAEGRILDGVKQDKPGIIVVDTTVEIEGVKITDFARDIDQYIQSNYQKIDNVGTAEILKRK